ncbi:MAG TPA: hypothetical protein DCM06_14065, partial [Comamonadaceae bacterium]|nr:hypothetical protein [Comamonadaceae bacterium]
MNAAVEPEITSLNEAVAGTDDEAAGHIDLGVGGMTCASCVSRVERVLKRVPGVIDATVNLAT